MASKKFWTVAVFMALGLAGCAGVPRDGALRLENHHSRQGHCRKLWVWAVDGWYLIHDGCAQ